MRQLRQPQPINGGNGVVKASRRQGNSRVRTVSSSRAKYTEMQFLHLPLDLTPVLRALSAMRLLNRTYRCQLAPLHPWLQGFLDVFSWTSSKRECAVQSCCGYPEALRTRLLLQRRQQQFAAKACPPLRPANKWRPASLFGKHSRGRKVV